jgi:Bacterial protein of unknown function (DUF899)
MGGQVQLKPAKELAMNNGARLPNESEEYRRARNALLAEEIELRRHIERVAEQRMCTSLLSAWDGEWPDVEQRIALADNTPEGRGTDWYPKLKYT